MTKVLTKIAKESGCQALSEWIKPCTNRLFFSATTTFNGNGLIIWAKFKSFFSHVTDIHSGLSDPLFDKCAHSSKFKKSKWLDEG